jgi:hypothetical protein
MADSLRTPYMVKDRVLHTLLKTGRPGFEVPSESTIYRDIPAVFEGCRTKVGNLLKVSLDVRRRLSDSPVCQEHDGYLNFATDAWTSTNNRPYLCFTVHFEHNGTPVSFVLDFAELPTSHTGKNMAQEFSKILGEFGVTEKVSQRPRLDENGLVLTFAAVAQHDMRQRVEQRHVDQGTRRAR